MSESTYIIDPGDPATERVWTNYQREQYDVRALVATAHRAIDVALARYAYLADRLSAAGDLSAAADYHAARAQAVDGQQEAQLVDLMRNALELIEQMEQTTPGLWPGLQQRVSPALAEEPMPDGPAATARAVDAPTRVFRE